METILRYKIVDFWVQVLAFALAFYCVTLPDLGPFVGYFMVGSVQVVSCIANAVFVKRVNLSRGRRYYESALLLLALSFVFATAGAKIYAATGDGILVYFFALLIVSPVMAFWYLAFSYIEMKNLKDDLKSHNSNTNADDTGDGEPTDNGERNAENVPAAAEEQTTMGNGANETEHYA